jgi:Kyakuja-Dileera-Zisupton transposase
MDGNNSLKRVDGAGHTDQRTFISDYIIPVSEVDQFKDDVRTRPGEAQEEECADLENEGTPPHGSDQTTCTNNWVAANTVSKETVQLFEQTGVFISACRHGIMQTIVEMRRSGELYVFLFLAWPVIINHYPVRNMASPLLTRS